MFSYVKKEHRELFLLFGILTVGLLLRLFVLDARTIHIDEGMGLRASELMSAGEWTYSPANGHGPTLFLVGAFLHSTVGLSLMTARLSMVIACMLAIGILGAFFTRRHSFAALCVLVLSLTWSSAMVFYSSYFIHEMLFFLFTVLGFCALSSWLENRKPFFLLLFALSCVCMYATKETAVLTWTSWIAASVVVFLDEPDIRKYMKRWSWPAFFLAFFCAAFLWVLLFSNGFHAMQSPVDAFRAIIQWSNRASVMHHRPFWYFGALLLAHEFPLVLGAFAVSAALFWKELWNRSLVWVALWFAFILLIYSFIPYKTPWCIPSILLPLALFVAGGFDVLWKTQRASHRVIGLCIAFLLGMQCVITISDAWVHPDRETMLDYAYLQSNESLKTMTTILHDLSLLRGGASMPLQIIGTSDELLYVLTEPYDHSFEPFQAGKPVYINYQNDIENMRSKLLISSIPYVRLIFTYVQHVNSVDVFVQEPLWNEYLAMHPEYAAHKNNADEYDFQ